MLKISYAGSRLSESISCNFGAIHFLNMRRSRKLWRKTLKRPYFWGSRSFGVIDVDTPTSSSPVLVMMGVLKMQYLTLADLFFPHPTRWPDSKLHGDYVEK